MPTFAHLLLDTGTKNFKCCILIFNVSMVSLAQNIEHEISAAHKQLKYQQIKKFIAVSLSDVVIITLVNVKMPTGNINEKNKVHAQLS